VEWTLEKTLENRMRLFEGILYNIYQSGYLRTF